MPRCVLVARRVRCGVGLMLCTVVAMAAQAFPDGAPWEVAAEPDGCNQCHFDATAIEESPALRITGLPERIEPGATYELTLALLEASIAKAGFLLTASEGPAPAGRFKALDDRTAAQGAQARSTEAGANPERVDRTEWTLEWTAPEEPLGAVSFAVWANVGNDDQSPFGDATHKRTWVRSMTSPL